MTSIGRRIINLFGRICAFITKKDSKKEIYCKHLRKAGREGWAGGIQCSKEKVVSPGHEKLKYIASISEKQGRRDGLAAYSAAKKRSSVRDMKSCKRKAPERKQRDRGPKMPRSWDHEKLTCRKRRASGQQESTGPGSRKAKMQEKERQ
ncbi:hypothetical protein JTE90_022227 [Oedothorax gibbosus]|uniref:Uncharacterized protein n=1 Tax=Oedothorax gibbosus TaxID=931172 RepID=A0AAV6UAN9_9ARAC|nr:hypothetical protein JTE90_022227 [Oedothorax gibbosus]